MSDKAKKIIGWICLVSSAILLVGEILTILTPLSEYANKTLVGHLISISMVIISGVFGFHLIRKKTGTNTIYHLIVFALLVTPIFYLEITSKINQAKIRMESFSLVLIFLAILSLFIIAIPYLFGGRILKNQESRRSLYKATPLQVLNIVGLGCSLWPSLMGLLYVWFGAPKSEIYYFIGFSYTASAIWWVWWRYFYFKV